MLIGAYQNHESNKARSIIANQIHQQNLVSTKVLSRFLNYESKLDDYIATPNTLNWQHFENSGNELNRWLDKASDIYGLSVKRWVDRFKVWQYQFQKELSPNLTNKKPENPSHYDILFFESEINKAINKAENSFRLNNYDQLLYNAQPSTAPHSLEKKIRNLYESKAKLLMPQAIKDFKSIVSKSIMTGCLGPYSNKLTAKNIAAHIAFLQYRTRYCSFTVTSKSDNPCYKFRHSSGLANKSVLVFCKIAEGLKSEEEKIANEKYGKLDFADYFEKYVKPLALSQKRAFEKNINSDSIVKYCQSDMQPEVSFRNPYIDAKTAAYIMYGDHFCKKYFKSTHSEFSDFMMLKQSVNKKQSHEVKNDK